MKRRIKGTLDLIDVIKEIKREKNILYTEITEKANLSEGLISRWKRIKGGPNFENVVSVLDIIGANLYVDTCPEEMLQNNSVSNRQIELIEAINSYLESNNKDANENLEKIVKILTNNNFSYNELLGVFLLFLLKLKQPT
jgi:transcriptional regulator with XRE-family HTH domain